MITEKMREIFEARVERRGGGEPWGWTGWRDPSGYAGFACGGKFYLGHRVAYEMEVGTLGPKERLTLLGLQRDDVNPKHWTIQGWGREHGSGLDIELARGIRARAAGGESLAYLASIYGVSERTVARVLANETFKE